MDQGLVRYGRRRLQDDTPLHAVPDEQELHVLSVGGVVLQFRQVQKRRRQASSVVLPPSVCPIGGHRRESVDDAWQGAERCGLLESLAAALKTIDRDSAAVLVQFVDSCLVEPRAKQMWRDLMTDIQYFWRHPLAEQVREEGRQEGREEGWAEAKAETVLQILQWRGIPVSFAARERVKACTDLDRLEVWAQRALQVTDSAELFVEE